MLTQMLCSHAETTRPYSAHFRCFRGCPGEYSVYEVMYTCPKCGGLLEVHHDVDALRDRTADEWKTLFESRVGTTKWPYGSGVWGMREWVMPTHARRERRQHVRGQHQPLLGRPPGQADRRARPVDQAVRQQPHRLASRTWA